MIKQFEVNFKLSNTWFYLGGQMLNFSENLLPQNFL
jgi:hypothetical protein